MAVRILSNDDKADIKRRIKNSLRDIVDGRPGSTITGESVSGFLAGPAPTNTIRAWQHRSGRAVCDRWARGSRPQILPGRDMYYRNLCSDYLGGGLPQAVAGTAPPFVGGQCEGVEYKPTISARRWSFDGLTDLGVITQEVSGAALGPFVRARLGSVNGQGRSQNLLIVRPNGTTQSVELFSWAAFANPVALVSARRTDGLPDDCGDFPGQYAEPTPNPTPDPNPGPVQGPVNFPFPFVDIDVDADGNVTVDFRDGTPPETIAPDEDEAGEQGQSGDPTDPGSPGEAEATGDGGEAEGEAPEGEEIVGLKVDVVSAPPGANTVGRTTATVYRGVGYVRLGYEGRLGVDVSGGVVFPVQFFHAPQRGLTHWSVSANLGFNLSVTPYYRTIEE